MLANNWLLKVFIYILLFFLLGMQDYISLESSEFDIRKSGKMGIFEIIDRDSNNVYLTVSDDIGEKSLAMYECWKTKEGMIRQV